MLPEPIVLLGATGQLGSAICEYLHQPVLAQSSKDLDLSDLSVLSKSISSCHPEIIINAAAYTHVDDAESNELAAQRVNADAVKTLAELASSMNIPMLHFSTDYVFSGKGSKPWTENDVTEPLNVYGHTKLLGEKAIIESGCKYLIFRTSWIYSEYGNNFVKTMLHLGQEKEIIHVVNDQVGAPTYARDLAEATVKILDNAISREEFPSGIYHIANQGVTSRFHFAEKIFSIARDEGYDLLVNEVIPIKTSDNPCRADRPLNSRMDMKKLSQTFELELPGWEDAVSRCVKNIVNKL